MKKLRAEDIIAIVDRLKSERQNWETQWQDCAEYCVPVKSYITRTYEKGTKVDTYIYDSTARQATQTLAAGLNGYLTNPSTKWFALRTQDLRYMDLPGVREWFHQVEEIIYNTLGSSNFYEQIIECYTDISVFGVCCLYEEEDEAEGVRFFTRPVEEFYAQENIKGRIDSVYRKYKLTAKKAYERWGDDAGASVKKAIDQYRLDEEFDFIHAVMPRHIRDVSKEDSINKPYASYYIAVEDKRVLEESGYTDFPFFVARFMKKSGDIYGYSPAMIALPDIQMLNTMRKTIIKAATKAVDPPMVLPHDSFIAPLKVTPSAINYTNNAFSKDSIQFLHSGANLPIGFEMEEQVRESIRRAFFVDLFLLMQQTPGMTATEVNQRNTEKLLILGQTLGKLMNELLDPVIKNTFSILAKDGKLPEVPEKLEDIDYVVEYTSFLAQQQKFKEVESINEFVLQASQLAQLNPQVLDKLDFDEIVDKTARIMSLDPALIKDKEEVAAIREQQAAAQQQQAQAEAVMQGVETAKTATEADKNIAQAQEVTGAV